MKTLKFVYNEIESIFQDWHIEDEVVICFFNGTWDILVEKLYPGRRNNLENPLKESFTENELIKYNSKEFRPFEPIKGKVILYENGKNIGEYKILTGGLGEGQICDLNGFTDHQWEIYFHVKKLN